MEGKQQGLTPSATTTVRLYVGGLGESVTSDDLHKIFSSSGSIECVDIIRTKGRSFAYIDFLPSSNNSLSKLFSTYNGCVWKGGRLRLEKAKEHYLTRLRREWHEDAHLASGASTKFDFNTEKRMELSEKTKNGLGSEKQQLRIFFPRLYKVKSIPFSGTGKHKYSFRRVEVPSLPTFLCDCEEHSGPMDKDKLGHVMDKEELGRGMDKEEVDMMNCIMNKLFDTQNISDVVCGEVKPAINRDNSIKAVDDLQFDAKKGDSTDEEDNLIINMVKGQETVMVNEKSRFNVMRGSEAGVTKEVLHVQRRNSMSPNKKRKVVLHDENDTNECLSAILEVKGTSHPQGHSDLSVKPVGSEFIKSELGHGQSAVSIPWSQKSSWRELIGNGGNNAFSISAILPSTSSTMKKPLLDNVCTFSGSEQKNLLKLDVQKGQPEKMEVIEEPAEAWPTKQDSASNKSDRGSSWLHKCSWTQLIGDNNINSFNITQILPGIAIEKLEQAKPDNPKDTNSADWKHGDVVLKDKREPTVGGSVDLGVANVGDVQNALATSQLIVGGNIDASASLVEEKHNSEIKETCAGDVTIGKTCLFMRSATSLKEWANAKAALSGSRKRKVNERYGELGVLYQTRGHRRPHFQTRPFWRHFWSF